MTKPHFLIILWTVVQSEILLNSQFPKDKGMMCMSQILMTGWLWSQPRTVYKNR